MYKQLLILLPVLSNYCLNNHFGITCLSKECLIAGYLELILLIEVFCNYSYVRRLHSVGLLQVQFLTVNFTKKTVKAVFTVWKLREN